MARIVDALKLLAVKITDATSVEDVDGNTVEEVIEFIAENYTEPETNEGGK